MASNNSAKIRRAKQLIALTLLAELKTDQRNLLSLILDKATFWIEDRNALRLPPLPKAVEMQLARSQDARLFKLREAVFSLSPQKTTTEARRLIYHNDIYRPSLPNKKLKH